MGNIVQRDFFLMTPSPTMRSVSFLTMWTVAPGSLSRNLLLTGMRSVRKLMVSSIILMSVFDKYIQCDNGRAFEFPCPNPLIFDVKVGSCVRKEQASELARLCEGAVFNEIDGFSCPGGDIVGPQNLLQAHPIHPHPTDCRYYFSCYHNKEPNKFGCSE